MHHLKRRELTCGSVAPTPVLFHLQPALPGQFPLIQPHPPVKLLQSCKHDGNEVSPSLACFLCPCQELKAALMVWLKEKRLLSAFLPSARLHWRSLIIPHSSESRLPGVKGGWGGLRQRLSLWELNMKIIREIATSGQILLSFPWYPNESRLPRKLSKKRSREWRGFLPSTWHLSCLTPKLVSQQEPCGGCNECWQHH